MFYIIVCQVAAHWNLKAAIQKMSSNLIGSWFDISNPLIRIALIVPFISNKQTFFIKLYWNQFINQQSLEDFKFIYYFIH